MHVYIHTSKTAASVDTKVIIILRIISFSASLSYLNSLHIKYNLHAFAHARHEQMT